MIPVMGRMWMPLMSYGRSDLVVARPKAGSLTLTGHAPSIFVPYTAATGLGELTISGKAPTVGVNTPVNAGVGSLTISGHAPTISAMSYTAILMLHMNGSNGGTTFTDDSYLNHTITPTNAITSTGQIKFGSSSGYFSSARLSVPNDVLDGLGRSDIPECTLETFFYPTSFSNVQMLWANDGSSTGDGLEWYIHNTGYIYVNSGGENIHYSTSLTLNTWNHLAVELVYRTSPTTIIDVYFYLNGSYLGFNSLPVPSTYSGGVAYIGQRRDGSLPIINGYLDDYRIVTSRIYNAANYSVPSEELSP